MKNNLLSKKSKLNDKITVPVKLPLLSLNIASSDLESVFLVLQGVSRYVSSIILSEKLVLNEGSDVLSLLQSRYPSKKIILDISKKNKVDDFVRNVVQNSVIDCFVVSKGHHMSSFKEVFQFINSNGKKIIFSGNKFDLNLLKKFNINHVLYYRFPTDEETVWIKNDFDQIQLLRDNGIFVTVGDVGANSIKQFKNIWIDEFLVAKEINYSFNPVQTCKLIYSQVKEVYLPNPK